MLINRILKARATKDLTAIVELDLDTIVPTFQLLPIMPVLNLTYLGGIQTLTQKIIEIRIYPYREDYNVTFNATAEDSADGIESLIEKTLTESSSYMNGSIAIMLQNLIQTITNAGVYAMGGDLKESFEVVFTYPTEKADGRMVFGSFQVRWKKYGKFMVYFVVDGIETNMAGIIEVVKLEASQVDYHMSMLEKYLVMLMCCLTLIANTPYHGQSWGIFAMCSVAATLVYTWMNSENVIWKYTISLGSLVMFFGLCRVFYDSAIQSKKKQRLIFVIREGLFYEYTYQTLFSQASKRWIKAKVQKAKKQRLGDTIPNPYIAIHKFEVAVWEPRRERMIKDISKSFYEKKIHYKDILKKYYSKGEVDNGKTFLQRVIEKYLFKYLYSVDINKRDEDLGVFERIQRMMGGFEAEYENILIKEAHFFPQRLVTGSIMSLLIVGVTGVLLVFGSLSLFAVLGVYQEKIKDAYMSQMSKALTQYKTEFAGAQFSEELFTAGQEKLQFITEQLTSLTFAVVLAIFFASIFATAMFLWGIMSLFEDFRLRILEMRKGKYPVGLKKLPLIGVTPLTGYIFANAIVAFAFNLMLCTMVFIPFCWTLTW